MSMILRWGLPALVSVVGGTLAAVSTTGAAIPTDLARRTGEVLTNSDAQWATISFEGRDAIVAGTAPTLETRDDLLRRVAEVHGVRAIFDDAVLADPDGTDDVAMRPEIAESAPETVAPWLEVHVVDGKLILDGAVPQSDLLDLLSNPQLNASDVDVTDGKASDAFVSGMNRLLQAAEKLGEGEISIRDGLVTASGRAKTSADYLYFVEEFGDLPSDLKVGELDISPPLASPYVFAVDKQAGGIVAVTGNLPAPDVRDRLVANLGDRANVDASFADGAPADFEVSVDKALDVLALLETGSIRFDGAAWQIAGEAPTRPQTVAAQAAFAVSGLDTAGWTLDLVDPQPAELPVAELFTLDVRKDESGTYAVSGYLPSEAAREILAQRIGATTVDATELARGEPDGFDAALAAGLDALAKLDQGTLSLSGADWSLSGDVATTAARHVVESELSAAPERGAWHVAIQAADAAALVSPFTWSAQKAADGKVLITGYVPTTELRNSLEAVAGGAATDRSLVGSGEPEDFGAVATSGLEMLAVLSEGTVSWDGENWSLSGQPVSVEAEQTIRSALGDGWSIELSAPTEASPAQVDTPAEPEGEAGTQVETAAVDPQAGTGDSLAETLDMSGRQFRFHVTKPLGGAAALEGSVPSQIAAGQLAALALADVSALTVDPTIPAAFVPTAEAGIRALVGLSDGQFGLEGDTWLFSGRAENAAGRAAALAALAAAPAGQQWTTDITILPPLDLCRSHIAAFASRNAILFQSGSALIAEDSMPAIDELVGYLGECLEANIEVEGHTDSDGDDAVNLALSVARAESVVDALISRGVSPDRLYAVGYGESLPVASNETRAGKQANRRIAFSVSEN